MQSGDSTKPFVFYSDKLNFKTTQGIKSKEYWVEGYISTGDMDLVNDIVTKSCMDSMLSQFDNRTIKLDYEHEAFIGNTPLEGERAKTRMPLGKAMSKSKDSKGVKVKWKMNDTWKKFDTKGNVVMDFKDIWKNIEEGYYDAFSIAYIPTRMQNLDRQGKTIRMLDDVRLLNVALTGNPVNPAATMSAVMAKSLDFMESINSEEQDKIEVKNIKNAGESGNLQMRCKTMSEENQDSKAPAAPAEPAKPAEQNAPAEQSQPSEPAPAAPAEPEAKSVMAQVKSEIASLKSEVEALKQSNSELKAIVEKARHKAIGTQEKKSQANVPELNGPLDMI